MKRSAGFVSICLVLSGCLFGYRWGAEIPEEFGKIHIAIFTNETEIADLEYDATTALKQEFLRLEKGILASPASADTLLEGTVVEYTPGSVLTESQGGTATARQVQITVSLRLVRQSDQAMVRDIPRVTATAVFRPEEGETEADARRKVMDELSRRIVFALMGEW